MSIAKIHKQLVEGRLEIVQNDLDPKFAVEMTDKEEQMILQIAKHFGKSGGLSDFKITLDSTVHGKVAMIHIKPFKKAYRFTKQDLSVLSKHNIRWVEGNQGIIQVGF